MRYRNPYNGGIMEYVIRDLAWYFLGILLGTGFGFSLGIKYMLKKFPDGVPEKYRDILS